ncbi:hypothetical protein [Herbaspirillum sp. CAH-3]|nr:hypothetical protein [Herbaspirillum sp. CAH-3]
MKRGITMGIIDWCHKHGAIGAVIYMMAFATGLVLVAIIADKLNKGD